MWDKMFLLLLLHSLEAAVASQCWQGATFSEMVVSLTVDSSGIMRVPGAVSLPQCVAACCDLPGYDLAWLFKGRCYVLRCQQREECRPLERPGADSVLVFLKRTSPQTLVLQSLVRGDPLGGRWTPLAQPSELGEDLEALKDLALFDGPQRGLSDSGMLDLEYSEGSQEERAGLGTEVDTISPRLVFNQSEAAQSKVQVRPSEAQNQTRRPADPAEEETTTESDLSSGPTSLTPTSGSAHSRTSTPGPDPSGPADVIRTTETPGQPLTASVENPVEQMLPTDAVNATITPGNTHKHTSDQIQLLQFDPIHTVTSDPQPLLQTITSSPTGSSSFSSPSACVLPPTTPSPAVVPEDIRGSNRGPLAIVGPDRILVLPLSSVLLDGSGSSDDRGISSYLWEVVSGPPGVKLEGADQAVATVMGIRVGRYTFRLTVCDQEGATDSASLTVRVEEARSLPPVAHASGSHTLTLPNNSLVLRGSVTDGDQTEVRYLWTRDVQSPAAGVALYRSETQASLYLADLVQGTYLFQLRVTDARGRSSIATATVEVRPGEILGLRSHKHLTLTPPPTQHYLLRTWGGRAGGAGDAGPTVSGERASEGHGGPTARCSDARPRQRCPGPSAAGTLSPQHGAAFLCWWPPGAPPCFQGGGSAEEPAAQREERLPAVQSPESGQRSCSGRGQCDPITKQCACDPFWTENLIRRYLGDGETNCEWRVLYVILSSFMLVIFILSASWTFICCCRRSRDARARRKTKYAILDNMDEQERVELRPRFNIKHRSTEHNSSLMMSESELDSDQDTVFSRDRPVRCKNQVSSQAARNGNAFG